MTDQDLEALRAQYNMTQEDALRLMESRELCENEFQMGVAAGILWGIRQSNYTQLKQAALLRDDRLSRAWNPPLKWTELPHCIDPWCDVNRFWNFLKSDQGNTRDPDFLEGFLQGAKDVFELVFPAPVAA